MPPDPVDFYEVLGVPRSATAEALRQAYKDQALRHHPDKNPEKVEAATEQFKLVAQAFSVLKDPRQRRAYDRKRGPDAGNVGPSSRKSSSSPDPEFSFETAKELFRDVFGDEFADVISRMAGGAVDKTRKIIARAKSSVTENSLVRSVAAAGYGAVVADAESQIEGLAERGNSLRVNAVESQGRLKMHVDDCREAEKRRKDREDHARCSSASSALRSGGAFVVAGAVWWSAWSLVFTTSAALAVAALLFRFGFQLRWVIRLLSQHERDRAEEDARRVVLQRDACQARHTLEKWRRESSEARARLAHAKRDAAEVHESGPSLGSVVQLGSHFAGKLVRRIASSGDSELMPKV